MKTTNKVWLEGLILLAVLTALIIIQVAVGR
jgi:hypothetical protein